MSDNRGSLEGAVTSKRDADGPLRVYALTVEEFGLFQQFAHGFEKCRGGGSLHGASPGAGLRIESICHYRSIETFYR